METKEYRYIDKTDWDRGEWDDEPDKVQWKDNETGLPCLAVRGLREGSLCGYVGVPESHPFFEKPYYFDLLLDLRVHGGLTFSAHCQQSDKEHGICHVPAPGEPDVWWLGFDCAQAFDLMPGVQSTVRKCNEANDKEWMKAFKYDIYRNLAYVKTECGKLARQLAAVKKADD